MSDAKWAIRDQQRLQYENRLLRTELARAKAYVAQLELNALLDKERHLHDQAWLQGKVLKQKQELNRLNLAREADAVVMEADDA